MRLRGDFRDIAGVASDGEVTISSVHTRPTAAGDQVLTRQLHRIGLVDGCFESPDLEPGPVLVQLHASGVYEQWGLVIPEGDGVANVASLIDSQVEWSPKVVAAAQKAAADAAAQVGVAHEWAGKASGSAGEAHEWADKAQESAAVAAVSETMVRRVVDDGVRVVRGEFTALSEAAEQSSLSAASQAAAAGEHEQAAREHAGNSKREAGLSAASATQAAKSAERAGEYAQGAAQSASVATQAADQAGKIAASTTWEGDVLTVNGQSSPPLTGPKGDRGDPGAEGPVGPPLPDTGWIDLSTTDEFDAGRIAIRRVGSEVFLGLKALRTAKPATTARKVCDLPSGFRPDVRFVGGVTRDNSINVSATLWTNGARHEFLRMSGSSSVGDQWTGQVSWPTEDAFPGGVKTVDWAARFTAMVSEANTYTDTTVNSVVYSAIENLDSGEVSADKQTSATGSYFVRQRFVVTDALGYIHSTSDIGPLSEDTELTNKRYVDSVATSVKESVAEKTAPIGEATHTPGGPDSGGKLVKARDEDGKLFYYRAPEETMEVANRGYVDIAVESAKSYTDISVPGRASNDAGEARFAGKILKARDSDGKFFYYGTPTNSLEVVNKRYVDSVTTPIKVVSRLPAKPDAGTLYLVKEQ